MSVQSKYQELVDAAKHAGVMNLQVREQDNILYIDGSTSGAIKQQLWNLYEKLDPDYSSGDLVLNLNSSAGVNIGASLRVTTNSTNLNIRKGPGTDQPIVGKAARHEIVTLVEKTNDQWWVIKTKDGEQGYSYTQYLTPLG